MKKKIREVKKKETMIIVEIPEEVKIKLVPANDLKYYELFQWLAIILLPIASGFWTAYITTGKESELKLSAIIFSAISILFITLAIWQRIKIFCSSVSKYDFLDRFKPLKKSKNNPKIKVK